LTLMRAHETPDLESENQMNPTSGFIYLRFWLRFWLRFRRRLTSFVALFAACLASMTIVSAVQATELAAASESEVRPIVRKAEPRAAQPARGPSRADGTVRLDFQDAAIADVVAAVVGDILRRPYSVDDRVAGKITLQTARPVSRGDVMLLLEKALAAQSAGIIQDGATVRIVPTSDLKDAANRPVGDGVAGVGVQTVPLRFVAARQLAETLKPIVQGK
jgi:type II secretory pathway component GspD/PulD (secretin)